MNTKVAASAFWACLIASLPVYSADYISPNGYSGLGLVPSAGVLSTGVAVLNYDNVLPGANNTAGYNNQVGFGLFDNLELVGRLATNDLRCNMFSAGACPKDNIRDFAASLKYSLPFNWLKNNNAKVAFGVTDVGGAASYFKSYYAVASKSYENFDFMLGHAVAKADNAMLNGNFAALTWNATSWSQLSLQKIGDNSWANAAVSVPVFDTGMNAWFNYNRRLNDSAVTEKQWTGFGVSIPLDRTKKTKQASGSAAIRLVAKIDESELVNALKKNGFYNPKIGKTPAGKIIVELENTSYSWNILDATGVALGLIAGTFADTAQDFDLIVSTRGIQQLLVRSNAQCVKQWLEADTLCEKFEIKSLNNQKYEDSELARSAGSSWQFRPEVVLSPTLIAPIGTEYSVFDIDLGLNVNTIVPLWKGAYTDINHIHPLEYRTTNFEQGGPFYAHRLKSVTSRRMLHQLLNFPMMNTQARLSTGMAYNVWNGSQIETSTQSGNGRHKFGLTMGSFKTDTLTDNNEKSYQLLSYRYAWDDAQKTTTELTNGKFWGGDNGYLVGQKFWHGDTSLMVYIKQSRLTEAAPLMSFAGIQFSIPLTPRKHTNLEHFAIRGTSQWAYTIESRIFDKENLLTFGHGEIPRIGDTLVQTFNRDRNTSQYYESSIGRIKNAFVNLSTD